MKIFLLFESLECFIAPPYNCFYYRVVTQSGVLKGREFIIGIGDFKKMVYFKETNEEGCKKEWKTIKQDGMKIEYPTSEFILNENCECYDVNNVINDILEKGGK